MRRRNLVREAGVRLGSLLTKPCPPSSTRVILPSLTTYLRAPSLLPLPAVDPSRRVTSLPRYTAAVMLPVYVIFSTASSVLCQNSRDRKSFSYMFSVCEQFSKRGLDGDEGADEGDEDIKAGGPESCLSGTPGPPDDWSRSRQDEEREEEEEEEEEVEDKEEEEEEVEDKEEEEN
ncbi:hypothetical protein Pmani_011795 [Petrolisthes manimaculis]|uniref:Uncharacterized protein n=1 Tax=Petrolisthes manimaculis TaxID=1843537 RepID=A0AAE1UB52_9EUCA|nr:hypothetical protein Pmani_011795 [Petrolisthes manimaculis]